MAQCAPGQSCATIGAIAACYDPTELDGSVVASGDGGPGGGGPDGTVGSGDDGSTVAPEGDAACVSFTADGGCYSCAPGLCSGGTCVNGNHDYSCSCFGGYAGTGTKSCVIANSCAASDQCPIGYPCAATAPPGQACVGEFASWPMPDDSAGAKAAPAYSNNGDGTVTDQVTTLVWQAQLPTPTNSCAGADAGVPSCDLAQAQAYCGALQLGGHGGWRVPTKIELESLLDCAAETAPTIANAFNNSEYTTPASTNARYFWTNSAYEQGAGYWLVDFGTCGDFPNNPASETDLSVRCVYGTGITPGTAATHYTINPGAIAAGLPDGGPDDTVTDNRTGLTWERTFLPNVSLDGAAAACGALGAGFRVPTYKELLTLVDPAHFTPAIDSAAFPGTPNLNFGSSTLVVPPNGSGYLVAFGDGRTLTADISQVADIRCVK
jgi:hypothetical protein